MASKPELTSRKLSGSLIILILYSLLSLGLTYPLPANLATTVPNDIGDPLLNTWILAWDTHALLTQPLALFQANIYHPLPQTLAYSEHLFSTALLALPVQLISGEPVVAYNLSLLLTFPLAAFGMYLLAWRRTRRRDAAFIAGLIFGFAPYRFAAIAHLQLLSFQWLPFALLFLDRILSRTRSSQPNSLPPLPTRHYLALGVFLLLQILASWYLALYTGLILVLDFGFWLLAAASDHWLTKQGSIRWPVPRFFGLSKLALTFLLVSLLSLPFAWPYLGLIDELRQARPLSLALSLAATPPDFAAAAPFNTLFGSLTAPFRSRPGFTEENTLFLGPVTSLLAVVALSYYVLRIAYYVLHPTHHLPWATGYALRNTALLFLTLLLAFPTPYAALAQLLPATTVVRVPPRWIIPALFGLAGVGALGFGVLQEYLARKSMAGLTRRGVNGLLFVLCSGLLLAESGSVPIPLAPVENRETLNPVYTWLAGQPKNFALVELPLHSAPAPEFPEVKRLYASTLGWWPLVNGYSGYTPPRQPLLAQALAAFPGPQAITTLQTLEQEINLPGSIQRRLYLLVHPGEAPLDRSQWEDHARWQAERNPALLPLAQWEGDYLYQVLPARHRVTTSPLATFRLGEAEISLLDAMPRLAAPGAEAAALPPALLLYWQTATPLPGDYTVFVHLRATDGFVRSQADGPPVSGRYPTSQWQPGEIVQDIHLLPAGEAFSQVDHLAIGLYDPATGERLPVFGVEAERLGDDTVVIPLH